MIDAKDETRESHPTDGDPGLIGGPPFRSVISDALGVSSSSAQIDSPVAWLK
jgi:hypothetical protein